MEPAKGKPERPPMSPRLTPRESGAGSGRFLVALRNGGAPLSVLTRGAWFGPHQVLQPVLHAPASARPFLLTHVRPGVPETHAGFDGVGAPSRLAGGRRAGAC